MSHRPANVEPLVRRSRIHAWFAARPRVLDVTVILMSTAPQAIALILQPIAHEWLAQLCIAGVAIALWFRRQRPVAVFLIVCVLAAITPLYLGSPAAGSPDLWFAAYALAAYSRLRVAIVGFVAGEAIFVIGSLLATLAGVSRPANGIDVVGLVALAVGVAARASNSRRAALEELATLREERAVAAERARITAEMHDVVAHSASVMIALAGGARAGWEKHPERARAALELLGTVGAQALEEMQRTLRVLREGDALLDEGLARSGYNLPSFDELVEVFRAAGMRVELSVPPELPDDPALRTTLYRIVQESLTNALRHAAGATLVEVEIELSGDAVSATVTDDGGPALAGLGAGLRAETVPREDAARRSGSAARAGSAARGVSAVRGGSAVQSDAGMRLGGELRSGSTASSGFGLRAMRERTAAFGGTLEAGPLPATPWAPRGGWRTRATLPLAHAGGSDG